MVHRFGRCWILLKAGFYLTIRRRPPLHGALILTSEERLFDAVVDKIPGKALLWIALAMNAKMGIERRSLEGLGPVALVFVGKEQEVGPYDDMNHEWYQIMLKKKSARATGSGVNT